MTKTVREAQRELRENMILDAAYTLLLEQGYQKMSMDELAERVGVAKMTLYQHFASKQALVVGVIVRGMRLVEKDLTELLASPRPALERLQAILTKGLDRRSLMARIHLELPPALVLQDPAYQAQYERFLAGWAQLIEQAKTEGTIDPTLSTPVLVQMLRSLYQADYADLIKSGVNPPELVHTLMTVLIYGMHNQPRVNH